MKKKRIFLFVGMAVCAISAWSQSVQMEITDIYGDKKQVDIRGGMSVYLPQLLDNDYYSNFVICDERGIPFYYIPKRDLASIQYKNVSGPVPPFDTSAYKEPSDGEYSYYSDFRWWVDGNRYIFPLTGEWTYDKSLTVQQLRTARGQRFDIPLGSTRSIELQDTIAGLGRQLSHLLGDSAQVYQWAFFNGSNSAKDYMGMEFSCHFPENSGFNYSLLVPTDKAMTHYVDIVSFKSMKSRVLDFYYVDKAFPISCYVYAYNDQTGEVGSRYTLERMTDGDITTRLGMILRSHTIMHSREEDRERGLRSGNEFYQALDGSVIRVIKDEHGNPVAVQGAYEVQNEQRGLDSATLSSQAVVPFRLSRANITNSKQKGDGWAYLLDNVIQPSSKSAYSVLSVDGTYPADNPFGAFMKLCEINEDIIRACGLVDEAHLTPTQQSAALKKYQIFIDNRGPDYNLSFVGNNSFTLYVPTNEAIAAEVSRNQLPTWEEIVAEYEALPKNEEGEFIMTAADSASLQRKCLRLVNFVKAHFQFGMEIADQLPFTREHNTAVVKAGSLATPQLTVRGLGKGKMTVTDETGNTCNIVDERKNIFVCDMSCSISPVNKSTMNGLAIDGYASGVIHQIDGVLKYRE